MPSRRHVLGSISAVGATSLAGCIGSQDTDSGTTTDYKWPTEGGDHRNSRAVPDGVAPREEPTVEWRTDLRSSLANGEPIVTNSTVLVNTGRDILAIDRETAERRWSIDPDNRPFRYSGAPAVLDGTVYAPEERTLTARSIASGEVRWRHEFDRIFSRSSPVVVERSDGPLVYAAAGNTVKAIDGDTGESQWEQEINGIVQHSIAYWPAGLYVATTGGELYAITRQGFVDWRRTIESGIKSAPIVFTSDDHRTGTGVAVATGRGSVQYFDHQGTLGWEASLPSFGEDGLAIAHRTLLARSGSVLVALDPNDGSERWRVDLGNGARNPPIAIGDTVYVGGDRFRGFDIDGGYGVRTHRIGAQRFERDLPGTVEFLTAADGKMFVTTDVGAADKETAELVVYS